MTAIATLETWLDEAKAARHSLAIGKNAVELSYDGKSVTYSKANMAALNAHIAWLKSELGYDGRRAIGVLF